MPVVRLLAVAGVLAALITTPAETLQRGGVVDVIPPEEVAGIMEAGNCSQSRSKREDAPSVARLREELGPPSIPDSIERYWHGDVSVLILFDVDAHGAVINQRIARYEYAGRTRQFTRGQRRVLEPELLDWAGWISFEDLGFELPLTGCQVAFAMAWN